MRAIPEDIMRKAKATFSKIMATYKIDADYPLLIAEALSAERQRCLDICAAEREWGDFHPDDVTKRIENGSGARQIPGWNCPSED